MITTLFLGFVTLMGKGLRVTKGDPDQYLPTSVQKSYFMLISVSELFTIERSGSAQQGEARL
jgi:hypothetical protein